MLQTLCTFSVRDWFVRRDNPRQSAEPDFPCSLLTASLLAGIGYYVGAKLGFALTFRPHPVSVMWPPNSIVLAALLLTPARHWWLVLLSVLPAHIATQLQSDVPLRMMGCWYVSNSVEALIGAGLIRWLCPGAFRFSGLANTGAFLLCGVLLGPLLSSFLDAAFVKINQWGEGSYWEVWWIRFSSNVVAALTITPAIVCCLGENRRWPSMDWRRSVEAALLGLGLLVGCNEVFLQDPSTPMTDPSLLYTPLPFLLWAQIRFRCGGAAVALLVTSLILIWGVSHGQGPFSGQSPEANVRSVQLFLVVTAVLLMLLGAVMSDSDHANERFSRVFHSSPDAILITRARGGRIIDINPQAERLFNLDRRDAIGQTPLELGLFPDNAFHVQVQSGMSKNECFRDIPIQVSRSGQLHDTLISADSEEIDGELCLIVIVRDITERRRMEAEAREVSGKLINAQEEERKRIARELHDDLNQRLALLSVELDLAQHEPCRLDSPTRKHLETIDSQLKDLSHEIHRLSYQLHPAKLEQLGLMSAARTLCRELAAQARVDIRFQHTEIPRDLDPLVALCLYRVLQEALHNSVRHSETAGIQVHLMCDPEQARLLIADAGKGFDVNAATNAGGLGLVSMRERVRQVNGSIVFKSAVDAGTLVAVTVPLPHQNAR